MTLSHSVSRVIFKETCQSELINVTAKGDKKRWMKSTKKSGFDKITHVPRA